MVAFVRGNKIAISGTFVAKAPQTGTPSSAQVKVAYTNLSGSNVIDTLAMTLASGVWTAVWDSTNCKGGEVSWVAQCFGGLVASAEGAFTIRANKANVG